MSTKKDKGNLDQSHPVSGTPADSSHSDVSHAMRMAAYGIRARISWELHGDVLVMIGHGCLRAVVFGTEGCGGYGYGGYGIFGPPCPMVQLHSGDVRVVMRGMEAAYRKLMGEPEQRAAHTASPLCKTDSEVPEEPEVIRKDLEAPIEP